MEILGVMNVNTPVPPDKTEPPEEAAYQSKVAPAEAVPDKLTVPVPVRAPSVVVSTVGSGFTVTVTAEEYTTASIEVETPLR